MAERAVHIGQTQVAVLTTHGRSRGRRQVIAAVALVAALATLSTRVPIAAVVARAALARDELDVAVRAFVELHQSLIIFILTCCSPSCCIVR